MKIRNLLLAGVLSTSMGLGLMMNPTMIQAEESAIETNEYEMAKLENLSLVLRNAELTEDYEKEVDFHDLKEGGFYSLDYEDLVEGNSIKDDVKNYYHTRFETLSPDMIQFFTEDGLVNVMESQDSGAMRHTHVRFNVQKAGTAEIKCTIYEVAHPENTKTETVTLTAKEAIDVDIKDIDFIVSDSPMELTPINHVYVRDSYYEYTATSYVDDFEYYWKNLTPEFASIYKSGGKEAGEPIVEGEATRGAILFKALAPGKAHFQCTIVDDNISRVVELYVDIEADDQGEVTPPVDNNNEITYTGSNDILANESLQNEVIDLIENASSSVTINLGIKEDLDTITLPQEVLEAANENDIPLIVNVLKDGQTTTWTFNNIDYVSDINLALTVAKTESVKEFSDKDGLVFHFYHNGKLPAGTSVKAYVGNKFKAGDKVKLSYFNEATNTLEEAKEYTVDKDGYVTIIINHCSKYVLEAVTKTPSTPSNENDNKDVVKETGDVHIGDTLTTFALLGLISACGIVVFRKKANQI